MIELCNEESYKHNNCRKFEKLFGGVEETMN